MDMLEALDGPAIRKIGDKEYTFPLWKTRELLPVLARIKAAKIKACEDRLKTENITGIARAQALFQIDTQVWDPLEAHIHFQTVDGVDECLIESLVRGGVPRAEAVDAIDTMRFINKKKLAFKVANIFEEEPTSTPPATTTTKTDTKGMGLGEGPRPEEPPTLGGTPASPPVPAPAGV